MSDLQQSATRSSYLAGVGVVLSMLACYGTILLIAILSLIGFTVAVNVHLWAAAIVLFAALALIGVALGYRRHRNVGPPVAAALGALLIVLSQYATGFLSGTAGLNSRVVEMLGFAALLLGAIWDWKKTRSSSKSL